MKLRIAIWAMAGALVVLTWSLCFMAMPANRLGDMWALVYLTIPISLVRNYPHFLDAYYGHVVNSMYFVLVTNAITYALVGLAVERLRRYHQHGRLIANRPMA
jgi:hypothetical protein